MEKLYEAQNLIEDLINKTPTGELRNALTDINILLSIGIMEVNDELEGYIQASNQTY